MENQHTKIKGYRDLSQKEIDLMNEIKTKAEEINLLIGKVRGHLFCQQRDSDLAMTQKDFGCAIESNRLIEAQPVRWLSIATTDLQTGLMELTRSVAQPTTF